MWRNARQGGPTRYGRTRPRCSSASCRRLSRRAWRIRRQGCGGVAGEHSTARARSRKRRKRTNRLNAKQCSKPFGRLKHCGWGERNDERCARLGEVVGLVAARRASVTCTDVPAPFVCFYSEMICTWTNVPTSEGCRAMVRLSLRS